MTLTGSHLYYESLREVKPEIIIIDESAEIIESDLAHLQSFNPKHIIQVGDHFQLRPIVQNQFLQDTYKYGFSQFSRLFSLQFPHTILEYQRRMTNYLANFVRLFYPSGTYLDTHQAQISKFIVSNKSQQDVILLPHTFQEVKHKYYPFRCNLFEAFICIKIAQRIIEMHSIEPQKISIIAMYKGQKYLIQETIKHHLSENIIQNIKVFTVDSFQGKENDVIILSCVRSNEDNQIGFLREMNRVNVAFSRARKAAFYVGNFSHLAQFNSKWREIIDLAANQNILKANGSNYFNDFVDEFKSVYYKSNQLRPKKCMFCKDRSHIWFCNQKIVKKQHISENFPTKNERNLLFQEFFIVPNKEEQNKEWEQNIVQENL